MEKRITKYRVIHVNRVTGKITVVKTFEVPNGRNPFIYRTRAERACNRAGNETVQSYIPGEGWK